MSNHAYLRHQIIKNKDVKDLIVYKYIIYNFGYLLCRSQVPLPPLQWPSHHLCLLWNTTFWIVFLFLMVSQYLQHPDNLYKIVFSYFFDSHVTSWSFATFMAALYFAAVATIAAFIGQHVVRKLIILFGRASLIIFILAFTIFVSAISLGEHYCSLLFCLLN